jgi:hypothetical protein
MVIDKRPDVNTPKVVFLGGKFWYKFIPPKYYFSVLVVHNSFITAWFHE